MRWKIAPGTLRDGLSRGWHLPDLDDSTWTSAAIPFEFQLHGLPPRGWFRGRLDRPHKLTGLDSRAVVFADGRRVSRLQGPYDACVAQGAVAIHVEEFPDRPDWVTHLLRPLFHSKVRGWKRQVRGIHGDWDAKRPDLRSGGWWRAPEPVDRVRLRWKGRLLEVAGPGRLVVAAGRAKATGEGRVLLDVGDPPRWRTWDRGGPSFLEVQVNGERHAVSFRTVAMGTRPRMRDLVADSVAYLDSFFLHLGLPQPRHSPDFWRFRLDGEELFLRATNYISDLHPERARDFERDIALLKEANLNCVRVHGHVEPPGFYRACSRAGLLVVQDLPLQWGYSPSVRAAAARAVASIVEDLRDEPSVAVWNVHNEPMPWDLLGLDRLLIGRVRRLDPTRPAIAGCGYAGVTMHAYSGWYVGDLRHIRHARPAACMELGAQAVPDGARDRACAQEVLLRRFSGSARSDDDLRERSQEYQAIVAQIGVEHFRRLKPRCRAVAHFMFADGNPAVTWSVLDYDRRPKPAFRALSRSMQPLLASLERYDHTAREGERVGGRVFVVNDTGRPRDVEVVVRANGDTRTFVASAPCDRAVPVGEAWLTATPGRMVVELEVREEGRVVSRNESWWRVARRGEA